MIQIRNPFFLASLWSLMMNVIAVHAQKVEPPAKPLPPLSIGPNNALSYAPDEQGNRMPDFSYAGYMASERAIPEAPVKIVVPVTKEDATVRIQAALDYVASLPADGNGFKGAVLLEKGIYHVNGGLKITSSGVVLRGSGMGKGGTVLFGVGKDRETLVTISGKNDKLVSDEVKIDDAYVPVNANKVNVASQQQFKAGETVIIHRPSTAKWIEALGTKSFGGGIDALGWKPGQRDIYWYRTITAIKGNEITLDVPLTTALDSTYGGGTIASYQWPGRISQVGVENLVCRSAYDETNAKDEAHRWMAITMENVSDGWVRRVVFEHFAGSAVALFETAQRITVEDCKSFAPVSEIGGQRRYTFFTTGQQTLFQRCYAEGGYHDFAAGFCAPGPNAFVQCHSQQPYSFSGAIDSWASGLLFDIVNVDGNALRFSNRGQDAQGAGWSAANSVFYQCTAAIVDCYKPPTATNWAYATWAQCSGDGYWAETNSSIQPRSLFYAQLSARMGNDVLKRANILPLKTDASSSPPVKVAMELTRLAKTPVLILNDWIDEVVQKTPIPINAPKEAYVKVPEGVSPTRTKTSPMHIQNGWLVRGGDIVGGRRHQVSWWRGNVQGRFGLRDATPHITRFVPGRTGTGLTDNLDSVAAWMKERRIVAIEHNYGLWYERRRDDHERIRRMDGEVWPPFYEQPFARSGQSYAWDGLSKYDLTKYNHWYWSRLKKYADLADEKGLVLVHQNYFQHNIIEAGAHYADFPWRTANNINNTGFPEPPPYAGDKRIFLAEQFYDITNPVRRKLNEAYIRKGLDNFTGNTSVIQFIGEEFTGPFHFVKFWLNTIDAWQKEKHQQPLIGLSVTKDVQDSVLANPALARLVDIIDIRYWHYQADEKLYAPQGGQNLAPRQHARLLNPKKTSFEQVYRAVREYRDKFPGKAIFYSGDSYDAFGWAALMAGGSMAAIPGVATPGFSAAVSGMHPVASSVKEQWILTNAKNEYIIYSGTGNVKVDLAKVAGQYTGRWIDPRTGTTTKEEKFEGGKQLDLKGQIGSVVLWLTKE